jgi:hypothetical protein
MGDKIEAVTVTDVYHDGDEKLKVEILDNVNEKRVYGTSGV